MPEKKPTIDQRLDRLTERHEALSQTVELFILESREIQARMAKSMGSLAESHTKLARAQTKTERILAETLESVNRLARIAHAHENRITNLEDRSPAA